MRQVLVSILMVVIMSGSVLAEQSTLKVVAIGGRQLNSHWDMVSVNIIIKTADGLDAWSFAGPRYKFGVNSQNFVDLFVGYTFPDGAAGTCILSSRLFLMLDQFTVWQDLEWYPEDKSVYTATELKWTIPYVEGLVLGIDVESFTPDYTATGTETIIHGGPLIAYDFTEKMNLAFTWHDRKNEFGGDFVKLTGTFLFF